MRVLWTSKPLRFPSLFLMAASLMLAAPARVEYRDGVFVTRESYFTVWLEQPGAATPLDGTYTLVDGENRFKPRYPPQPGADYRVTFSNASEVIRIPPRAARPAATVTHVAPTGSTVPENLLKFYLQFSAPMSRGEAVRRIHLLGPNGAEVSAPFLEIDEELWDRDVRRLTLLFDPGRIKRGLLPLKEVGGSLVPGQGYTLVIDGSWPDAYGQPLAREFRHTFTVGAADRTAVIPKAWRITVPTPSQPLIIDFGEPVDSALAPRLIRILDAGKNPIIGLAVLERHESRFNFTPETPWASGTYTIEVNPALEDLAGNRVNRVFDVDRFDRVATPKDRAPATRLSFSVK